MKKHIYLLASILLASGTAFGQLVITEINYNPRTSNSQGKAGGIEFVEILNNGTSTINLKGVNFPQTANNGMEYIFGNVPLPAGDRVCITNDSLAFVGTYGTPAFEYTGFVLNGGYTLILQDSLGGRYDSVTYENSIPWPETAAGEGTSIELCDPNTDNSQAANWERSTLDNGLIGAGRKIYSSPYTAPACPTSPVIHMRYRTASVDEDAGAATFGVFLDGSNGGQTTVDVKVVAISGDVATDIQFTSPTTVTFTGNTDEMVDFTVNIVDDTLDEGDEKFYFILENENNGIISNDTMELTIFTDPNDKPVNREMKLIGVTDADPAGAVRIIEIMALANIPDMSIYGLGVANNGGGTDGIEYNFPATAGVKDQHYFVTNDSAGFVSFFGFAPDFIGPGGQQGMFNYNGDDAVELFENGRKIDGYGDPVIDGTGEAWEYVNGWGKRVEGTGPDDRTWVEANWTFGGIDALTGFAVNDSCAKPYPFPQDTTISIHSLTLHDEVVLFPNPVNSVVNLRSAEKMNEVVIRDMLGNTVATETNVQETIEFDVSDYDNGVYFIYIKDENENVIVKKFMKN